MSRSEDAAFWTPITLGVEAPSGHEETADFSDTSLDDGLVQLSEAPADVAADVSEEDDRTDEPMESESRRPILDRAKDALSRHKGKLILGAIATSAALTFMNNPATEVAQAAAEAVPLVGGALIASETLFIGGGVMMTSAVGKKVGNPLTIKNRISEIATAADDSWLFKAGFVTNTIGAFGTAGAVMASTITMPQETYPAALAVAAADVALTVAVRKTIIDGIRNNRMISVDEQP